MSSRERIVDAPIESVRAIPIVRPELSTVNAPMTDLFQATTSEIRLKLAVDSSDPLHAVWREQAQPALRNQFRGLRRELLTALDAATKRGAASTLLVTSALPGDGKTFIASAIARTFARTPEQRVSLIDLDLMRRRATQLFSAQSLPGVTDCLLSRTSLPRVFYQTDIPQLRFVPAGSRIEDSREAFVGAQLDETLAALRASGPNSLHIIDAPPVIPVVETAILAAKVDLVLLVVRAGQTPASAVDDAIERLGEKVKPCLVLNATTQHVLSNEYDYGYSEYE